MNDGAWKRARVSIPVSGLQRPTPRPLVPPALVGGAGVDPASSGSEPDVVAGLRTPINSAPIAVCFGLDDPDLVLGHVRASPVELVPDRRFARRTFALQERCTAVVLVGLGRCTGTAPVGDAFTARRVTLLPRIAMSGVAGRIRTDVIPLCRRAPSCSATATIGTGGECRTPSDRFWRPAGRNRCSPAKWLAGWGSNPPHSRLTAGRAPPECYLPIRTGAAGRTRTGHHQLGRLRP